MVYEDEKNLELNAAPNEDEKVMIKPKKEKRDYKTQEQTL